jgi:predicted phage tail component-like protein
MYSVNFGDKNSYNDFNLLLRPKTRPFPTPKTNYVSIEGRDGDLDLTTSLTGDVKYENISYSLEFYLKDKREDWETKLLELTTYLHGKKMNLTFSEDADYYYVGRFTLNPLEQDRNLGMLVVSCILEPYRYRKTETVKTITGTGTLILSNTRKWVMPVITSTVSTQFKFEGKTFTVNGTLQTPEIILKEGESTIEVTSGTGTLSIRYREAKL